MRRLTQLNRHSPPDKIGDCYRTCIACLLDLESPSEVPHFYEIHPGEDEESVGRAHALRDSFLADRGLVVVQIAFNCSLTSLMRMMGTINPDVHWMLMGESRNGCNHIVVCRGGDIVCDPAQDQSGIVGPADDGHFWVEFLVPRHEA